jgi:endonuclease/exonuclease/phosphatase (EEP) superfamily protein YafD
VTSIRNLSPAARSWGDHLQNSVVERVTLEAIQRLCPEQNTIINLLTALKRRSNCPYRRRASVFRVTRSRQTAESAGRTVMVQAHHSISLP